MTFVRALVFVAAAVTFANSAEATACLSRTWVPGQQLDAHWTRQLVTIDYDHDGKLDLAGIVNDEMDQVLLWHNEGGGTFSAATVLLTSDNNVGGSIPDLAVADVNSDGIADLVVAYQNLIRIYRGTGSGLAEPQDVETTIFLTRIAAGNFDGDAAPELVVTGAYMPGFAFFDNVAGSFSETRRVITADYPIDVTAADFDADGRSDVAITLRFTEYEGAVEVYFRNADGTYTAPLSLPAGSFPRVIANGDFNDDGLADLAVTNWYDGNVSLYRNLGARQFAATTLDAGYPGFEFMTPDSLVTEDVTGDGIDDLMVGVTNGGWLATFASTGDGAFASPSYVYLRNEPGLGTLLNAIATGDFDGDSDLDVAIGSHKIVIAASACATQVTLTAEAQLVSSNAEARLNVAVSGFGSNITGPLGTITLRKGATTAGTATPDANGKATFVLAPLTAGEHVFTAEFSGNAQLAAATSNEVTQRVTDAVTTVTITTPPTQPVYGTQWPISVSVTGGNFPSNQWVTVYVDGVPHDLYTANDLELSLTPGPHAIYAEFEGSYSLPPATSATLNVTALKATPVVGAGGAVTVRHGASHALQFTVSGPAGAAVPAGSVQLFSGNSQIGSGTVTNGVANVSVTLPRGSHTVRAAYSGDGNYNSAETFVALHVVDNQPLTIEARGLQTAIHIAYAVPAGTSSMTLYRRAAGSGSWEPATGWNSGTGIDSFSAQRGVLYEYQLHTVTGGIAQQSNVDGALLFTDDPVAAGATPVRRAHFTELRTAVNLLRAAAGLAPFAFDATFTGGNVIRAWHLQSLQSAAAEARSALGMSAVTFDAFSSGTAIGAAHLSQTRDAVR